MKIIIALIVLMTIGYVHSAHLLTPRTSEEMLNHIQGNNYNVYLLYFYDGRANDGATRNANQDIENTISGILSANSELFYAKLDSSNKNLAQVADVVGVTTTPAVLLMVHGKGVWLTASNSQLAMDRIKDFLPTFKQASAHHTSPL